MKINGFLPMKYFPSMFIDFVYSRLRTIVESTCGNLAEREMQRLLLSLLSCSEMVALIKSHKQEHVSVSNRSKDFQTADAMKKKFDAFYHALLPKGYIGWSIARNFMLII